MKKLYRLHCQYSLEKTPENNICSKVIYSMIKNVLYNKCVWIYHFGWQITLSYFIQATPLCYEENAILQKKQYFLKWYIEYIIKNVILSFCKNYNWNIGLDLCLTKIVLVSYDYIWLVDLLFLRNRRSFMHYCLYLGAKISCEEYFISNDRDNFELFRLSEISNAWNTCIYLSELGENDVLLNQNVIKDICILSLVTVEYSSRYSLVNLDYFISIIWIQVCNVYFCEMFPILTRFKNLDKRELTPGIRTWCIYCTEGMFFMIYILLFCYSSLV